jgi:hypothetical protein
VYANQNSEDENYSDHYLKLIRFREDLIYSMAGNSFEKTKKGEGFLTQEIISDYSSCETDSHSQEEMSLIIDMEELDKEFNSNEENKASYQVFQENLKTLNQLMSDIEKFSADLQARPKAYISYRAIGGVAVFVYMLAFIAIETWIGIMSDRYRDLYYNFSDPNHQQYRDLSHNYFKFALGFGLSNGIILSMVATIAFSIVGYIPKKISHNEWDPLIEKINKILVALQATEKQENKMREEHPEVENNYLPVEPKLIRALERILSEFDTENIAIEKANKDILCLNRKLKKVEKGMIKTNRPFSFFQQPQKQLPFSGKGKDEMLMETAPLMKKG